MDTALYIAGILAIGIGAQWIAWRFRLPAIVLLLLFGVLLGKVAAPDTEDNHEFFFASVSLAVGIILFEGGLSLNFQEIQQTRASVIRLVTIGLLTTWVATSWLAYAVAGFSTQISLLIGAMLTVSGPTVILPLLRHVQPVRRIGSLVKWEGIVNDPIGAVLAALVFEGLLHGSAESVASDSLANLGRTLLYAVLLSVASAALLVQMLRRYWVPDYLVNPVILSLVMLLFAISNSLQSESGLVTVTLLGVILANQRIVEIRHVMEFKENLRVLLIGMLFIVLASRLEITTEALRMLGWESVAFVALLVLVVRPLSVFIATVGSTLSWQERVLLCWLHPRGIVAAAVSSLFALSLAEDQSPLAAEGDRFELLVFFVIMGTVTIYGLTIAPLARWLGLSGENPQGILFAGASPPVREIAAAVKAEGFPVLLVDTNPRHNSNARMAGLPVSFASISSEYVQEQIDLGGIGRLLAMTPNDEVNTLATLNFAERFGKAGCFKIAPSEAAKPPSEKAPRHQGGRVLFDKPMTYEQLTSRFAAGERTKKTLLTSDFTYDDFRARYGDSALVLFIVNEEGELEVATSDAPVEPRPGEKIIALVQEVDQPAKVAAKKEEAKARNAKKEDAAKQKSEDKTPA